MRRFPAILAVVLAVVVAFAPALAEARAGSSLSMGSRGGRTYSAPPTTSTAPSSAAPMQRSMTPQAPSAPSYATPGISPGFAQPYRGSSFMSGLMGGLIGAGIGGMLFGHGMFGGGGFGGGFGGVLGLLLQLVLLVFIVRFVLRLIFARRQPVFAGMGGFARNAASMPAGGAALPAASGAAPVTITRTDYEAFDRLLKDVQAAWTAQDLNALRALSTPEMVGYFGEQLAEQASQGVRNTVIDVRLEQGDLSEAWSEGSREYATVAMRFSMLDATRDASGRVVGGSDSMRTQATELWTFLRAPGGRWVLSAIQQAR